MKLLYKGSECGVPCTCPAVEEEYVWWKYPYSLVMTGGSDYPHADLTLPCPIKPIGYRMTESTGDLKRLYVNVYDASTKIEQLEVEHDVNLSGQDLILYDSSAFENHEATRLSLSFYTKNTAANTFRLDDVQILVSKSDYAKLVEASGS